MVTFADIKNKKKAVAVVGLGYVGLPLAVALAKYFDVIGFDISQERIAELKRGQDSTREVDFAQLKAHSIFFTTEAAELKRAGIIIVTVPTPIDHHHKPDLTPVISATYTVGANMSSGSVVIYESTVYPGVTEDLCVPILQKTSNLILGQNFAVGYSPERINPGDKLHTLETVTKVVAASDQATLKLLARVYGLVVKAGIHRAPSIKVAEAAKAIENTQRDINIALMNELSLIFERLNIDTLSVLEAAGTKWNFLPFRPGLVGGHCIGVDPYYLTYKAEEVGYHPEIILAGRRVNDNMGKYVAAACVKLLIKLDARIVGARVGILGITFKENIPDIRNSRVVDIIAELREFGITTLVHDPMAYATETMHEYNITLTSMNKLNNLDALILAVPHEQYHALRPEDLRALFRKQEKALVMDIKGFWDKQQLQQAGFTVWRL